MDKLLYKRRKGIKYFLMDEIGVEEYNSYLYSGLIYEKNHYWYLSKKGKRLYESIYKEPNWFESIMGYYYHYILRL